MLLALWGFAARAATYALLVNGGDRPDTNYRTHLDHLREVRTTLVERGIPPENISVFSADGEASGADMTVGLPAFDNRSWLVEGTRIDALAPSRELVDSTWEGVDLRSATGLELRSWFDRDARRIQPGDTLMIYVTDHGIRGTQSVEDASIALWHERLSVAQFRELLQHLHPEVRVMVTMSQCYAGSFAEALYPVQGEVPDSNRCGWFAAPPDRPSYGCYAESRDQSIGHGFRWSEALSRRSSLADAHDEVLLTDRTPDVPLASTDVHIQRLLQHEARRRAMLPETLVDQLLAESAANPTQRAQEHRATVHALAASIGAGTPLTLAEVRRLQAPLPTAYDGLIEGGRMWAQVLWEARDRNLEAFLDANPRWRRKLARAERLDQDERYALLVTLLDDLEQATPASELDRIRDLVERYEQARTGAWRTAVREGVVLRMTYILRRIAAEQMLTTDAPHLAPHRAALEELASCETVAPGRIPGHAAAMSAPKREPMPPLVDDLTILEGVTAPWLGATFGPVSQSRTEHLGLPGGAIALHVVFEDSPAERAGLIPGDILVGPPDTPFATPSAMLEWMMTAERGKPHPIKLWRGYESYQTHLELEPWLDHHRAEPERAEAIASWWLYDVDGLPILEPDGPYLLFFWATWCGPCKAAAPEVAAWSAETGVPVLAVTDEDLARVGIWRQRLRTPFPTIAIDPQRTLHGDLGITELPTFVHVDGDGRVLARQEGYSALNGLFP